MALPNFSRTRSRRFRSTELAKNSWSSTASGVLANALAPKDARKDS
jgi:hypothetical protein